MQLRAILSAILREEVCCFVCIQLSAAWLSLDILTSKPGSKVVLWLGVASQRSASFLLGNISITIITLSPPSLIT
jgi:hypothetical protein